MEKLSLVTGIKQGNWQGIHKNGSAIQIMNSFKERDSDFLNKCQALFILEPGCNGEFETTTEQIMRYTD